MNRERIEAALGLAVTDVSPLSGGCIGQVYRLRLADGRQIVAKVDERPESWLGREGKMLTYLAAHSDLPVPTVLHQEQGLLLMEYLPGESHFTARAQEHAAELLAALHQVTAAAYGLEMPTLIGGLHQPNPWTDSWLAFFREQRLLFMGQEGVRSGRLPTAVFRRLADLCEHLDNWLEEPERPSLIHGDVWTTNVLAVGDRITGFVDPAIYYADPEIELAFTTLFGTFGRPFFARYGEIRPLKPGFFEERRDLYNLYPLLVHVRLFGGSYVHSVDLTLQQFGF
ncbi:MAG: fructosamine kinase family protein [Anaerolineales bacterium]|nr:fructosamine kinase family protein [Anaerolineales bacterium]